MGASDLPMHPNLLRTNSQLKLKDWQNVVIIRTVYYLCNYYSFD